MSRLFKEPAKVLLTGGTSGIGAFLRDRLLAHSNEVMVIARTASQLPKRDGLHGVQCDLSDPDAVRSSIAQIAADHPDISVVINNAAFQYSRTLRDPNFEPTRLDDEVTINLLAPALIVNGLLPILLAQRRPCAIINIGSGLALFPKRQTALYCATKAALHSFSQSLRYQLDDTPVRVIEAILPLVDTPMTKGRGGHKLSPTTVAAEVIAQAARGRDEIYIGKAKILPVLARLAPSIPRAILKRS